MTRSFLLLGIIGHSTRPLIQRGQYDSKVIFLATPISLATLICEDEADDETQQKPEHKKLPTYLDVNPNNRKELKTVKTLKEPIVLKELKRHSVQSIKDRQDKVQKRSRWIENVLKVFEYSNVYPFIYKHCKYKCFVCTDWFLDVNTLKAHSERHSLAEIDKELRNRIDHNTVKVDVTCLKCKICSKTIPELQDLKDHLKAHGKVIADPRDHIVPFKLGNSTIACQICGEVYLNMKLLITHMNQHFNNFSCEVCGAAFMSIRSLKCHQQSHVNGHFPCDKCQKVFSNKTKRNLHYKSVHLKKSFSRCPICNERFSSTYRRAKHLRIVHNEAGRHRCDTCGREYDMKNTLTAHIRYMHLQERNIECQICHSHFFSKYCLSRHMVIHTGEKNFKCDFCEKTFARRNRLTEHLKSCSVVGPMCALCGHNFPDNDSLVAHFDAVHGVKT